jgi:hypothetical protein
MKKTFNFSHPKKQRPRVVEAIKYELKKYIKRERNKKRSEEVDFWDFDCRYGANEASCDKGSFLLFLALGYFCIINADVPYFFNLETEVVII